MRILLITHYYPPINSSGAKRAESLSKYFTVLGHHVTVLTTSKSAADGAFTEIAPDGVNVIELDWTGRERQSENADGTFEPMYSSKPSWKRRLKDRVMDRLGQIPDPRLPFAIAFLLPWFSKSAKVAIKEADIVIGTTPPWPMILAAYFCKWRFDKKCVLDYRDHFSECHEMPGGRFAKWLEKIVDRKLAASADHVVCISEPMTSYYKTLAPRVDTILNGYDHEMIESARNSRSSLQDGYVRVRYMGIVSPGRVPHNLLKALVKLNIARPDLFERLRFEFFGNASLIMEILESTYPSVASAFNFFQPVPYFQSLQKILEADYLLFSETSSINTLSAKGILTTKLFEYIGSGRPILADISQDTLAGELLVKSGGSHIVGTEPELFFNAMIDNSFYQNALDVHSPIADSLSRKAQAERYVHLLQSLDN